MKPSPYTGRVVIADTASDSPRLWRWLGVAVALVATLAWWGGREDPSTPSEQAQAYASPLGPAPELPARAAAAAVATVTVAAPAERPAVQACKGPTFSLLLEGRMQPQCIGPMQSLQNGSLRSHRAEPEDGGARWLQIDTAGGVLVSVTVGRAAVAEYGCEAAGCNGVTLGAADRRGERTILFDNLRLTRLPDAPATLLDEGTLVSARLTSRAPAAADEAPACGAPNLVVDSSSLAASQGFCAQDGMAVERNDDGGRIHRFASIDGPSIAVSSNARGELLRIEYGTLACNATQCAGAELTAAGSEGPIELALNGTVLTPEDGQPGWASLRGRLRSP